MQGYHSNSIQFYDRPETPHGVYSSLQTRRLLNSTEPFFQMITIFKNCRFSYTQRNRKASQT